MIILKQVLDISILLKTTKSHLLLGLQGLHSLSNLLFIIQSCSLLLNIVSTQSTNFILYLKIFIFRLFSK